MSTFFPETVENEKKGCYTTWENDCDTVTEYGYMKNCRKGRMRSERMKGKRVGAFLLSVVLTMSVLGGCGSGNEITEAMIPSVTDLRSDETAQANAISLAMNKSYVAELTRLDGDNTQMAVVDEKEVPVVLKATSVDKDLKVKIVNEKNDKVITGTAFEVSVTDSANKTKSYTDSDKDGII